MSLLDVGCGPATVTVDLADRVGDGRVVGVDASEAVLDSARELAAQRGTANISFQHANAYELPFADGTFDVVYAHQLLQHLSDPIGALREMRRVTKPGGLVAVRDADYAAMTWYPESPGLTEWNTLYHEVTHAYGYEADAGRRLFSWVQDAGFPLDGIEPSASTWCYATPADRTWWGGLWAERCVASNFAVQAKESALADDVALEQLAQDWLRWAEEPAGWFAGRGPRPRVIDRARPDSLGPCASRDSPPETTPATPSSSRRGTARTSRSSRATRSTCPSRRRASASSWATASGSSHR